MGGISTFKEPQYSKFFAPNNQFGLPPATVAAIFKVSQVVVDANLPYGVVDLADAANISTDASLGTDFYVTLEGNRTMDTPTNPTAGQIIRYWITQDFTGSRTLAWSGGFRFSADIPSPTLTTTPEFMDMVEFAYHPTFATWDCIRVVKGFDAVPM